VIVATFLDHLVDHNWGSVYVFASWTWSARLTSSLYLYPAQEP